jgi:uncharacterized membrane protein YeaQ/YmgE (transglycosylase-associated protein family)
MPTFDQIAVWIVIGFIGGGYASALAAWDRRGYGRMRNLAIGLAGAVVGGLISRLFNIWPDLDRFTLSLRDVVAAFLGSLVVLGAIWVARRMKRPGEAGP